MSTWVLAPICVLLLFAPRLCCLEMKADAGSTTFCLERSVKLICQTTTVDDLQTECQSLTSSDFVWYKDNQILSQSQNQKLSFIDCGRQLWIVNASFVDSGQYHCSIGNISAASVNIVVKDCIPMVTVNSSYYPGCFQHPVFVLITMQNVESFVTPHFIFDNKDVPSYLYAYNHARKLLVIHSPNSSYNGEWKILVNGLTSAYTRFTLNVTDCCGIPEVKLVRVNCTELNATFGVEVKNVRRHGAAVIPSVYFNDQIASTDLYLYNYTQKLFVVFPPRNLSTTAWSIVFPADCGTAVGNITVNMTGCRTNGASIVKGMDCLDIFFLLIMFLFSLS